ncbi:MAG: hypothetical protein ABSA11_16710 [Candidatus Bathyarchaeia archaeon]|jgi:hypothetical protein
MVDLAEIQTVYYMVAATGVLVAAVFYIANLRETTRNRKATFANNAWHTMLTPEWQKLYMEVSSMRWRDFDDFKRKYDSSVDVESYAKRMSIWTNFDSLGWQLRQGSIDIDSFPDVWALGIVRTWQKCKPIIEGYRGWQWPKSAFRDFEYLAGVLEKKLMDEDPDFMKKMNNVISPPEAHQ